MLLTGSDGVGLVGQQGSCFLSLLIFTKTNYRLRTAALAALLPCSLPVTFEATADDVSLPIGSKVDVCDAVELSESLIELCRCYRLLSVVFTPDPELAVDVFSLLACFRVEVKLLVGERPDRVGAGAICLGC